MIALHAKNNDPKILKQAMNNLLKRKDYHIAHPTKKNEMFRKEYTKILNKEKELKRRVLYGKKSF
jgi:hypothetical protein